MWGSWIKGSALSVVEKILNVLTFAKNVVQKSAVSVRHVGERTGNQAVALVKSVTNHHSQVTLLQYHLDYRLLVHHIIHKSMHIWS